MDIVYPLNCLRCIRTRSALEALRNALYKCSTYLLTYLLTVSGVPQGTVLGPVLFVVFVNDTVTCTDSSVSVKLFADDVNLYTVISDEFSCGKLQISLDNIYSWSNHWQLKLSPSKCTVLHLKSRRSCHQDPLYDVSYSCPFVQLLILVLAMIIILALDLIFITLSRRPHSEPNSF